MSISCYNCFHKEVCSDNLLRQTVYEYGDCREFLDKSRVTVAPIVEEPKYFTPEQVRKMSREEVRENYYFILESMKKWSSEVKDED